MVDDQRGSPTYVGHLARPFGGSSTTTFRRGCGTSRPQATAPGRTSPRRSSRRRASTARFGVSRRRSSLAPHRGPGTPCSAASTRGPRSCRTGVKDCVPVSRRWAASLPWCASSSPAEPGSSARTSSATGSSGTPTTRSSSRPAHVRREPRRTCADVEDRDRVRPGRHRRRDLAESTLPRRTRSTSSSTSPPSRTTASPSSTRAGSSAPTCSAPRRCCDARARQAWRASTTSRPARSTATSRSTPRARSPRSRRTGPARRTTRRRRRPTTSCAAYHETFGLPITHHELLQQLRPVPVPREGRPALHDARARRPAAAAVRVDAEPARVAPRPRPLPAPSTSCSSEGRAGETYNVGTGVEASDRGDRRPRARRARASPQSLKTIVPDRPGHDRRYLLDTLEDPARARVGAGTSSSRTAWPRRSAGTPRTATGGSRSRRAHRSKKLPGNKLYRGLASRPGRIGREHKLVTPRS